MGSSLAPGSQKNKCPAVRNSRKISTERQFTPSGSISYLIVRRFKSAFWFCNLRSFQAWAYHQLAMSLCSASYLGQRLQAGSAKFARRARKVSLSRKPYSSICPLCWSWSSLLFLLQTLQVKHFAYYLALEKNKGALETEDEPFTAFLNEMKFLISGIGCRFAKL